MKKGLYLAFQYPYVAENFYIKFNHLFQYITFMLKISSI